MTDGEIPERCRQSFRTVTKGTVAVLAVALLLLITAFPGSVLAQGGTGTKGAASPNPDEVVSLKDKTRFKGQVRDKTSASAIQFTPANKPVQLLSSKEYRISVWRGVTDAGELWQQAQQQEAALAETLGRLERAEGIEATLLDEAKKQHKLLMEALAQMRAFPTREILDSLPLETPLSNEAAEALVGLDDVKKKYRRLELVTQGPLAARKTLLGLRGLLRLATYQLQDRNFRDLQAECSMLEADLEQKAIELAAREQPNVAQRHFQRGVRQLNLVAKHCDDAKAITTKPLSLLTVEADFIVLGTATKQVRDASSSVQMLGSEITDLVATELKALDGHQTRFKAYRDLTTDVRDSLKVFDRIISDSAKAAVPDEKQLANRLAAQRRQLDEVISDLATAKPQDLAQLAIKEAQAVADSYQNQGSGLQLRQELVHVAAALKQISSVKTQADAEKSLAELTGLVTTLQGFLDKKQLTAMKDQSDCRDAVQRLNDGLQRVRERMADFDRNDVRIAFDQLTTQQGALYARLVDADGNGVAQKIEELRRATATLADDYNGRVKTLKLKPQGAIALIQDIQAARDDLDRVLNFMALSRDLEGINAVPNDQRQLRSSEDRLKAVRTEIDDQRRQLPPGADPLGKATQGEVARIERSLKVAAANLSFKALEQDAANNVAKVTADMKARRLPSAGAGLLQAQAQLTQLTDLAKTDPILAADGSYTKRVTAITDALQSLESQVAVARQKERAEAGWIAWKNDSETLVSPHADHRWWGIESALSRGDLDDAEKALNDFKQLFGAQDPWPQRILLKQTELSFQRGRQLERLGQFEAAREFYQKAASASVEHPIVVAAAVAARNIDEHLRQVQGERMSWLPWVVTGLFLIFTCGVLAVGVWKRSPQVQLKVARKRLADASQARADRRAVMLREAAYALATLPANDPQVIELWGQYKVEARRPEVARTEEASLRIAALPAPSPAEALDAALRLVTSPEVVGQQCLNWLRSGPAWKGSQRKRTSRVMEWLRIHSQPADGDVSSELQRKLRLAAECEPLLDSRQAWPRLNQLRANVRLGECRAALTAARDLAWKKLSPAEREEALRMLGACYVELGRWDEADEFFESLKRKGISLSEGENWLDEWQTVARAGKLAASLPPRPTAEASTTATAVENQVTA